MTDMNYEQKYKAALERARQVHTTNVDENKKSTEYIFPELVESKDERIKKTLIDYFKNYKTQEDIGIKTFFGIPTDDIISWLEKQGEQKPADKVEPLDEFAGLTDFERTLADICIGWIGKELRKGLSKPLP